MHLSLSSQRLAGFSSLCYISMSMLVVGSFILFTSNVCLAKPFVPSVISSCTIALGTVTRINGQQLLVTPKQGNTPIHVEYSNTTHILKEDIVDSPALKRGISAQVLAPTGSNQAERVILYPSNNARQSPPLGCQISQTSQTPVATPSGNGSSSGPISGQGPLASLPKGIIQQVTNNTFTISFHTDQLKTFTWSTKTQFIQYTDYQPPKMLSSGAPVLLIGPMRNGVIMASRIAVLLQGQVKASFKRATNDCSDLGLFLNSCSGPDNCSDQGLSYSCAGQDNCSDLGLSYSCAGQDNCTDLGLSYSCTGPGDCSDLGLIFYTCSGDDQDTPDI